MKPYNKYKNSGIKLIGDIPKHWEIKKIKHVAKIFGRIGYRGYKTTDLVDKGNGAITISPSNMKDYNMDFSNCTYLSWEKYEESPEIKVYNGDILFVKTGSTYGKSSIVSNLNEKATINPQSIVIKEIKCNNELLWYIIKSKGVQFQVEETVVGGTIPTISQEKINNYKFPLTSDKNEQTQIANYLDKKTTQIDQTIIQKEKLIELYEEEKKAIINQAVTKGLNKNVKLKSSGIDRLGDIPELWELKKLKHCSIINNEQLSEKTDDDYQIRYIDIGSINNQILQKKTEVLLFKNAPSRARRIVKQGDTIVSTVRTYLKAILHIDFEDNNLIASTGFAVVSPLTKYFINKFLYFLLSSELIINEVDSKSVGVSYPAINSVVFSNIVVWIPSTKEQTQIVRHIEEQSERINKAVTKAKKEIELIKEYRQALIFEAVTGKIDVREEAI